VLRTESQGRRKGLPEDKANPGTARLVSPTGQAVVPISDHESAARFPVAADVFPGEVSPRIDES